MRRKRGVVPAAQIIIERKRQVACIIGMAMLWPSLHNQLLYPVTFSFHKDGADAPYLYYLIYSLIIFATTALLAFGNRERFAQRLFNSRNALVAIGLAGAAGITLLVICDFSHDLSRWLMGLGVILAGASLPIYFMFWSQQIVYASEKRAAFDLILSYLLFSVITLVRLLLHIHSWPFAICFPLISAAMVIFVFQGAEKTKKRYALTKTSISTLPLHLIIPAVVFVYLATIARCLMNPLSATYDYSPDQRVLVYVLMIAFALVLIAFYRPHAQIRRYANLPAFTITVAIVAIGILCTGLSALQPTMGFGNFPSIIGINALQLLIWVFVLANAQVKHSGVLRSSALYLIFVIGLCHLASVLAVASMGTFDVDASELPLMGITIVLAFLVVIVVNTTMTALLYRAQKRQSTAGAIGAVAMPDVEEASGAPSEDAANACAPPAAPPQVFAPGTVPPDHMPPCIALATDEVVFSKIQESFGLSKRESDTMRLAARNMSAKEMADALFVAESTVNSHLKRIYRKCDVHSRQELIALVNRFRHQQTL